QPFGQAFEFAERAGRLGKRRIAGPHIGRGLEIGSGHIADQSADVIERQASYTHENPRLETVASIAGRDWRHKGVAGTVWKRWKVAHPRRRYRSRCAVPHALALASSAGAQTGAAHGRDVGVPAD